MSNPYYQVTYEPTATEQALIDNVTTRVRAWEEIGPYYTDERFGVPKTKQSRGTESILNAFVLARYDALSGTLSDDARLAFDHLWAMQEQTGEEKGGWPWLVFGLQPWESDDSPFYGAALAAVAVGMAPDDYASAPDVQERLDLLRGYFSRHYETQPLFNRMTLLWASATVPGILDGGQQQRLVDEVFEKQREDGGWSLTSLGTWKRRDDTELDTKSDDRLQRGLDWLRQSQDGAEGSWPATSLNRDRDPMSDRGRFMRDVATAYAVLALSDAD